MNKRNKINTTLLRGEIQLALFLVGFVFGVGIAMFSPSMGNAAQTSTVEIQQDMQLQYRELEGLQAKYRNLKSLGASEINEIEEEIEAVKLKIQTSPKGSTIQLEGKTLLSELLSDKHIRQWQIKDKQILLLDEIVDRVIKVEENIEEMKGIIGSRGDAEVKAMKETILTFLNREFSAQQLQGQVLRNALNTSANPLLIEQLESSEKYLESTKGLVRDLLLRQNPDRTDVYARQQVVAFKMRAMFDTLRAKLLGDKIHLEQVLTALKGNAELQSAALMATLMKGTVGNIVQEIEGTFDEFGQNRQHSKDWESVNHTEPEMSLFDF